MGNHNRPKIDQDDIELMKKIGRHNFVDMIYVYRFYKVNCKKRTVNDRINQLASHNYLNVIKTFIPPEYTATQETVYKIISLGSRGIELMKNLGENIESNLGALKNASSYRMYHQAQVSTVCDQLELSFKDSNSKYEVAQILNEKEAFLEEVSNMPDAIILFRPKPEYITNNREMYIVVFVELERSYASFKRVKSKMLGYENAIKDKVYIKKFGLPIIDQRVLFVSQTDGQFQTIKDKIAETEYDGIGVLMAKYSEVCDKPTDRIYINPKNNNNYKLLSNLEE